jgi:hypothetical protein
MLNDCGLLRSGRYENQAGKYSAHGVASVETHNGKVLPNLSELILQYRLLQRATRRGKKDRSVSMLIFSDRYHKGMREGATGPASVQETAERTYSGVVQ